MRLRALAQGRDCQVRIVGVCNANPETTVLCHYRLIGVSGLGRKSPDLLAAWACSACHNWIDSHKDCETERAFLRGVIRTQARLIEEQEVKW